jgi:hypothetical protein
MIEVELICPSCNLPLRIQCDASQVGEVLAQSGIREHPTCPKRVLDPGVYGELSFKRWSV